MKRFVLYLLIFFVSVMVIDQAIGLACDYMQHNSKKGQIQQFDDFLLHDEHDILIMGSSRAHHHYVSEILEDSLKCDVYNAGADGNGIIYANEALDIILERYKPKMILYDIEPCFDVNIYMEDYDRKTYLIPFRPYYRHQGISNIYKEISYDEFIKVHSGLCRYNSNLMYLLAEFIVGRYYFPKGYYPLYGAMDSNRIKVHNEAGECDTVKIKYLESFAGKCKSNGINLVLIYSPKWANVDETTLSTIDKLGRYYQLPILNYTTLYDNHPEFFKEPMHLNDSGAREYSRFIAYTIKHQSIYNP